MERKENLYPMLPMAPPIEDQEQRYRLQKINEIQALFEKEVVIREALSKRYFRAARIVENVDTVLIAITLGGGAGGIGLLSMVIAAPAVIAIEGVALFTGFLSIIGKYSVKKSVKLFQNLTSSFEEEDFLRISSCPYSARSPHSPEPCLWTDQSFGTIF